MEYNAEKKGQIINEQQKRKYISGGTGFWLPDSVYHTGAWSIGTLGGLRSSRFTGSRTVWRCDQYFCGWYGQCIHVDDYIYYYQSGNGVHGNYWTAYG